MVHTEINQKLLIKINKQKQELRHHLMPGAEAALPEEITKQEKEVRYTVAVLSCSFFAQFYFLVINLRYCSAL